MNKYTSLTPWEKVELARHKSRPTTKYYIFSILDHFVELKGDRCFSDDLSIIGGIGKIGSIPITVIGTLKGATLDENVACNFGMPKPEGYRKALKLMKQAEKFKRPILCFIDTPGAFCGVSAEERGIGITIANNLYEMSQIKTPIISIFTGEGGSGGALALGIADRILILENATYSILSPEGFASILWKDSSRVEEAAEVMRITATDLLQLQIVDDIISEPPGGAHLNPSLMASILKERIKEELYQISTLSVNHLLQKRYIKFRQIGNMWD